MRYYIYWLHNVSYLLHNTVQYTVTLLHKYGRILYTVLAAARTAGPAEAPGLLAALGNCAGPE